MEVEISSLHQFSYDFWVHIVEIHRQWWNVLFKTSLSFCQHETRLMSRAKCSRAQCTAPQNKHASTCKVRKTSFLNFTSSMCCKHARCNQREKRVTSATGDSVNACDVTEKCWTREDTLFLQSFNPVEIVEIGCLPAMLQNLFLWLVIRFIVLYIFFI